MTQTQDPPAKAEQQKTEENAIQPMDMAALDRVMVDGDVSLLTACKAIAQSGMFPDIKRASQGIVKALYGRELGITLMSSMTQVHWISFKKRDGSTESRLEPSYHLRAAMIKRSGKYDYLRIAQDAQHCAIEFFERHPVTNEFVSAGVSEYSMEQAKKMGLLDRSGGKWQDDPESMLFAAALRRGARKFCPDLFLGFGEDLDNDASVAAQLMEGKDTAPAPEYVDAEFAEEPEVTESDETPVDVDEAEPDPDSAPADEERSDDEPAGSAEQPTLEDVPPVEDAALPLTVGFIDIPPAPGGPHEPAADTADRMKSDDVLRLRKAMKTVCLDGSALEHVWRARYGYEINAGGRLEHGSALEEFIAEKAAEIKAAAK